MFIDVDIHVRWYGPTKNKNKNVSVPKRYYGSNQSLGVRSEFGGPSSTGGRSRKVTPLMSTLDAVGTLKRKDWSDIHYDYHGPWYGTPGDEILFRLTQKSLFSFEVDIGTDIQRRQWGRSHTSFSPCVVGEVRDPRSPFSEVGGTLCRRGLLLHPITSETGGGGRRPRGPGSGRLRHLRPSLASTGGSPPVQGP